MEKNITRGSFFTFIALCDKIKNLEAYIPSVESFNSLTEFLISISKYNSLNIGCFKRASLAYAAQLPDTLCPPEAPFDRLRSH